MKSDSVRSRESSSGTPMCSAARGLALLLFTFLVSLPVCSQTLDSLRSPLAGALSAPDFAVRLQKAADQAATVQDSISLFSEFTPKVKEGDARRGLFLRWAALLELQGRWEEAAARYEDAAFAAPGQRDTASLLECARAWLAAGETEKAYSILKVLQIASPDAAVTARARILEGWALLLDGKADAARGIAEKSAVDAPDGESRLAALILLWAGSEGSARSAAAARIKNDFPASPEAILAESGKVPPAAHWLLTGAAGAGRPASAPKAGSPADPASASIKPKEGARDGKPASVVDGPLPLPEEDGPGAKISAFQVGAFSEEGNASVLVKELAGRGFAASVLRKEVGGKVFWSVLVQAGKDAQSQLLRLKDAGYEAYPLF